jgi:hypothetical protein
MLIKAAEFEKNWRVKREIVRKENEERIQQEQEIRHKREHEQQMVTNLFDNAATWNKCMPARNFIEAVRRQAKKKLEGDSIDSWVKWAKQQVEEMETSLDAPISDSFFQN